MLKGSSQPNSPQHLTESILFGGYEPLSMVLQLTVEAFSMEEAGRRMHAVARLVNIQKSEQLIVLVMKRPSRTVPLFMEGYFKAIKLGTEMSSCPSHCDFDLSSNSGVLKPLLELV